MDYKCKTAVIIVFFNRPNCLREVIKSVRKVAPPVLYFAQDGCRDKDDFEKVLECQRIVEHEIDWDCIVKTRYSEANIGCEENEYTGIKWAFENEERLIILEDDVVPSVSFFRFCDELLEKYKDDQRINAINGFLNVDYQSPYSYVFCNIGSSYGWATWRRSFALWDPSIAICDNTHEYRLLKGILRQDFVMTKIWSKRIQTQHKLYDGRCQGWESLYFLSRACYSQHCICSTKNLIKNIGLGDDALHGGYKSLSRKQIAVFERDGVEIDFPLKHPPFIIHDYELDIASSKIACNYKWWKKFIPIKLKKLYHFIFKKRVARCRAQNNRSLNSPR